MSRYSTTLVLDVEDEHGLSEVELATHLDERRLRLSVEDVGEGLAVFGELQEADVRTLRDALSGWLDG